MPHHASFTLTLTQARLTREQLDSLPGHVATRADAACAQVCAICLCEPECGDAHSKLRAPSWRRHSSAALPAQGRLSSLMAAVRRAWGEPLRRPGPKGRRRRCSRAAGPDSPSLRLEHFQVVCTLACAHSFHKACVTQRRRLLEVPPWQCNSLPPRPPGTRGCAPGPPYTFERSAAAASQPLRPQWQRSVQARAQVSDCDFQHPGGCSARSSARSARRTRWVRRRSSTCLEGSPTLHDIHQIFALARLPY